MSAHPTHRIKATGDLVFPEGYDAAELEELPSDFWRKSDFALGEEKKRLWKLRKAQHDRELSDGVEVPGIGWVDSDPASRAAIDSLFLASLADPESFAREFTLADNTRVAIDAAGIRAIKTAIDQYSKALRAARDDYRERLDKSTSVTGARRLK